MQTPAAKKSRLRTGLALILCAVVVVVLACLTATRPWWRSHRRQADADLRCNIHLRMVALALVVYAEESNGGFLPPSDERLWVPRIRQNLGDRPNVYLFCPLDDERHGLSSYRLPASVGGLEVSTVLDDGKVPILTEKRPLHRGGSMTAFADGSVRLVPIR